MIGLSANGKRRTGAWSGVGSGVCRVVSRVLRSPLLTGLAVRALHVIPASVAPGRRRVESPVRTFRESPA